MLFSQILQTFRDSALQIFPLFIIALIISSFSAEFFSARVLDKLLRRYKDRDILAAASLGMILPATPAYRVLMAAVARLGGAGWTSVLVFIGAGAGAGMATIIMTAALGWQFVGLRLVATLVYLLLVSLIFSRITASWLAVPPANTDVGSLLSSDFCEGRAQDIEKNGGNLNFAGVRQRFLSLFRLTLPWLLLSIFLAALAQLMLPVIGLEGFLSNRASAAWVALAGLPFYFVGGLEVPLLRVLLSEGMSMGAAITVMLAVPVINLPVMSLMGRWLGYKNMFIFMAVCWFVAAIVGLLFGFMGAN